MLVRRALVRMSELCGNWKIWTLHSQANAPTGSECQIHFTGSLIPTIAFRPGMHLCKCQNSKATRNLGLWSNFGFCIRMRIRGDGARMHDPLH